MRLPTFQLLSSPLLTTSSLYPMRLSNHRDKVSKYSRFLLDLSERDQQKGNLTTFATLSFLSSSTSDDDVDAAPVASFPACRLSLRCPLYLNSLSSTVDAFISTTDQATLYSLACELGYTSMDRAPSCIKEGRVLEHCLSNFPSLLPPSVPVSPPSARVVAALSIVPHGPSAASIQAGGPSHQATSSAFWSECLRRLEPPSRRVEAPGTAKHPPPPPRQAARWCGLCLDYCGEVAGVALQLEVRCMGCGPARVYCSKKCRDTDWRGGHQNDCPNDDEGLRAKDTVDPAGAEGGAGAEEGTESILPPMEVFVALAVAALAFMYRAYVKEKFLAELNNNQNAQAEF